MTNVFDQKENERRVAMGMPPLPRRGRKSLQGFTKQDVDEYLTEVRGASMSMFPGYTETEREQYVEKIKKKVLSEIASASKGRRKNRPKPTDSVVIVDEGGTSSITVEQLQRIGAPVVQPSDRMLATERPPAGEDGASLRQRISKFERDVFRTAFPTLSRFIDHIDTKTKQESRDRSTESMQVRRTLDRTENMAQALNDFALQQNRSTELLAQLLDAVKGLNRQPDESPSINPRGRLGRRLSRALRRAAPYAAGAAAAAGGAYALSRITETGVATHEAQEQVTREQARRAGVIDRAGRMIPLPPELAALPMSNAIQGDAIKQVQSKPANDAAPVDAAVVEKTPAGNYNADISQFAGSDLMMKAKTITFKGDEIEFAGQQNDATAVTPTGFSGGSRLATPVSAPGATATMTPARSASRAAATGGVGVQTSIGGGAVSAQVPPEGRALLDAIAQGEGGRHGYNAINYVAAERFGRRFESFERHPFQGQRGFTAAGRYQMLWTTFEPYMRRLGLNDFGPESQDRAAWALAQDAYSRSTRRNLAEDLRNPQMHGTIAQALAPTWHALAGAGGQRFVATLQQGIQQQSAAAPVGGGGETAAIGMQTMAASQENAMAERTPAAPAVIAPPADMTASMPTPGAAVPTTVQNPNDPGPVEPDDAAERYARLFNMAA